MNLQAGRGSDVVDSRFLLKLLNLQDRGDVLALVAAVLPGEPLGLDGWCRSRPVSTLRKRKQDVSDTLYLGTPAPIAKPRRRLSFKSKSDDMLARD